MWDAEKDDDASFERRLHNIVREIGDRGKAQVSEVVPPTVVAMPRTPAPTPAPAPTLASAPSPAPTPTPTPDVASTLAPAVAPVPMAASFTTQGPQPSIVQPWTHSTQHERPTTPLEATQGHGRGGSGSIVGSNFADMASFLAEHQQLQMERDAKAQADRAEFEASLEVQRREMEVQRREIEELRLAAERQKQEVEKIKTDTMRRRLREEQVSSLQSRLESLHSAKLLTEDEWYTMEDLIADSIEEWEDECAEVGVSRGASSKVASLVTLSARMASDRTFARQVRRKYVE